MGAFVRFDDLTPGAGASFEFAGPGEVVVAEHVGEVSGALRRAEELRLAGWWLAGFIAYDAAPGIDGGLVVPPGRSDADPPLVWLSAYRERAAVAPLSASARRGGGLPEWAPEVTGEQYESAIGVIRDLIAAGDTYQVNHTFRLRAAFSGDPFDLYRRLALGQHGGYCAFIDTGDHQIASASPERFFRVSGTSIRVKPMKGTIRRGRWPSEDDRLAEQLLASEKDRAENLMIVDLLRNDLGRISEFGSVSADRLLDVERYDTVWQLTSEVSAVLREDVGLPEVFGALFPSGSVTGAPKQRTMEIIADLETSPRGVYCGAIGFAAPSAAGLEARFNVAIRTAVVNAGRGEVEYGVGGGITWDSTAAGEYDEAMLKADLLHAGPAPPALLETLRWEGDHGFWLAERHLGRLEASAGYFGIPVNTEEVRAELAAAVEGRLPPLLVRLTLDRDGVPRAQPGSELPPLGTQDAPGGAIRVAISDRPIDSTSVLLFHKTVLRDGYEDRRSRRPDVDDVVLVNERGEVTETTIANIAVRIGQRWVTPPLGSGCLPGTYRAELLDGGDLEEAVVTLDDLRAASEVAAFNSVRGWREASVAD